MLTLEELEARLNALEAKLEGQSKRLVLRESLVCSGCGNTEILHISKLETYGLPVRVDQEGTFSITPIGVLELYVCSQCGYGEVQLDPSRLKEKDRAQVKIISKAREEIPEEPYR
jgi:hypothetical protein